MSDALAWLAARAPAPPAPLGSWLADRAGDVEPTPAGLAEAGRRALSRALARPGRDRASAFELLGADALLTYACEAALDARDPEAELRAIARRVAAADRAD